MSNIRACLLVVSLSLLSACGGGGGGSTKPDPQPTTTCSQRLGTGSFVTSTVTNPSVTDSTCPSGSTLTRSGISYTTSTTTYSCPDPNAAANPVASSVTSAPVVTQSKICTVIMTCSEKLATAAFQTQTETVTTTDSSCPTGQTVVQNGLSQFTRTTSYSCANPASTADPVASISNTSPVLTQPKVCNLSAPINYSTYFRDKTGVTQANAAGYTGSGVKIAVYDNGFNVNNAALSGRYERTFGDLTDDSPDNTSHGTSVAAITAGKAVGDYPGGVAPGATLALADWDSNIYDIIDWGAKVFNFSFGYGYDAEDPANSAPDSNDADSGDVAAYVAPWVAEMRAIRDAGAFLAISAGNDGEETGYDSAQVLAAAPYFYNDLNNVVAVVAMSPLNGTKAPYSNPCGATAMNFCLAAPGTVNLLLPTVNAGDTPTVDSYEWFAGTSAAAPVVSGIAALVYQAFPGINGNQVRDTLLTTATDLGALGVDPVYGWGYVNAAKAVQGPGLLLTSFEADVPESANWSFGNDIGGGGGLVKIGGGGLNLTGDNTYAGGTQVRDGDLNLYGAVTGDVRLDGGRFSAFGGHVGGDLYANGGTLGLVTGDVLTVDGSVHLQGADLRVLAPAGYTTQWRGEVLNAAAVIGTADAAADSIWFDAAAAFGENAVRVDLQRKAVTDVLAAYSATQADSAANLETAFRQLDAGFGSEALRASAGRLQATDADGAGLALMALSGQSQTTMKDIALETTDALLPLLGERLHDIPRTDGEGGFWLMTANPDGRKHADGYLAADIDSRIWAAGVDRGFDGTSLGAALFSADDRVAYDGVGDRVRGDRKGLALYARHQGEVWYWQGFATFSDFDADVTRTLSTGAGSSFADSRSRGSQRGLSLEAGRPLSGGFTAALSAGIDRVALDAFAESGGTGLELGFESAAFTRALIGPDLRFEHGFGAGWLWNARVGYRHVLGDVDTGMRAYYTGLPGVGFTVDGMPYADGFLDWALGLGYRRGPAYWYLRSDGQQHDNGRRLSLSAGVRIGF